MPSAPLANGRQKIADSDSDSDSDSKTLPLPPPLQGRGYESFFPSFLQKLKEDFASAYVGSSHFNEEAFDRYFRDSWLVKITDNGVAVIDSSQPTLLREGLGKFDKRLRSTFLEVSGMQVTFQVASRANGAVA